MAATNEKSKRGPTCMIFSSQKNELKFFTPVITSPLILNQRHRMKVSHVLVDCVAMDRVARCLIERVCRWCCTRWKLRHSSNNAPHVTAIGNRTPQQSRRWLAWMILLRRLFFFCFLQQHVWAFRSWGNPSFWWGSFFWRTWGKRKKIVVLLRFIFSFFLLLFQFVGTKTICSYPLVLVLEYRSLCKTVIKFVLSTMVKHTHTHVGSKIVAYSKWTNKTYVLYHKRIQSIYRQLRYFGPKKLGEFSAA